MLQFLVSTMVRLHANARFRLLLALPVAFLIVFFLYQLNSRGFLSPPRYGVGGSDATAQQPLEQQHIDPAPTKLGAIIAAGRAETNLEYMGQFEEKYECTLGTSLLS